MKETARTMSDVVGVGFRGAVRSLESELEVMPLSRWNESILRYFFCRSLATACQDAKQFVECGRIDLVLTCGPSRAFVEFKFYAQPTRFEPYGRDTPGRKGRPSPKNLGEFQACIDQLHTRRVVPGLSKYVVLVYADPASEAHRGPRYSSYYAEYRHSRADVPIQLIEASEPIHGDGAIVRAHLYQVGAPNDDVQVEAVGGG
jgi:hypothetical protein